MRMIEQEDLLEDTFQLSTEAEQVANAPVKVATDVYFKGGHWGQCLELLQHLCQYSENIVLVLGEPGLGKTTLMQALEASTGDFFQYLPLDAEDYHATDSLFSAIAAGFAVGKYMTQVSLAANLATASARDDKVWVLLLDNAHMLSDDILQALVNLFGLANTVKTQGKSRLRLVLFGEPRLEQKLEAAKLQTERQENSHVLELEPLTPVEVEAYLQYKWHASGNKLALPFDNNVIKKIIDLAAGNPSKIERLVRDQLAGVKLGLPKRKKRANAWTMPKIPLMGLIQGGLVIIGLTGLAIFLLKPMLINSAPNQLVKIEMSAPRAKSIQLQEKQIANKQEVAEAVEAELPQSVAAILQAKTDPAAVAEQPTAVLPRVLELEQLAKEKFKQTEESPQQTASSKTATVSEQTTAAVVEPTADMASNIAKQEGPITVAVAATSPAAEKITSEHSDANKTAVVNELQKQQVAVLKQGPANPTTVQANKKNITKESLNLAATPSQGREKILSLPSSNFTLQLLGAGKISGIEQFIKQNKLGNHAYYYRSSRQNQPWYILLYGNYPSKEQAKAALARLPAAVRAQNPWVRDIAGVKKALPKAN